MNSTPQKGHNVERIRIIRQRPVVHPRFSTLLRFLPAVLIAPSKLQLQWLRLMANVWVWLANSPLSVSPPVFHRFPGCFWRWVLPAFAVGFSAPTPFGLDWFLFRCGYCFSSYWCWCAINFRYCFAFVCFNLRFVLRFFAFPFEIGHKICKWMWWDEFLFRWYFHSQPNWFTSA